MNYGKITSNEYYKLFKTNNMFKRIEDSLRHRGYDFKKIIANKSKEVNITINLEMLQCSLYEIRQREEDIIAFQICGTLHIGKSNMGSFSIFMNCNFTKKLLDCNILL